MTMAGKTKTPEEIAAAEEAKARAKKANAAKEAEHEKKINTPDPELAAKAAEGDSADETQKADGQDDGATEAESLAAKALGGDELSADEVKKVAARALGKGDDFEGVLGALAARIAIVEEKIGELVDENTRIMKRLRKDGVKTVKDEKTLHGSIDDLGEVE